MASLYNSIKSNKTRLNSLDRSASDMNAEGPRGSLSTFDGSSDDLCDSPGDLGSPSWSRRKFRCPCKGVNSQLGQPGGLWVSTVQVHV